MAGLESLRFTNRFTRDLPGDPDTRNLRRQVRGACWSRVNPTPVAKPELVAYSREVAESVDLEITPDNEQALADVMGGNRLLEGMDPFAMCYGGHQFGNWAGQLGDGRAINLGEVVNRKGEHWTLQLKGAGPTPYSRTADGLAVLRSSVREFLCSEAMHHLGVPTTRALSLVSTGESVVRDMFYDGNPRHEPGAVVCRVAPSFARFGNFQIFAARQEHDLLKQLTDFTLRSDFPNLGEPSPEAYTALFHEVCARTADMIIHWMRVGFVHGVMNTDNMSILGLTIDYGPYGWLEDYDPDWTPNTTDAQGRRYRFGAQPQIALWNLLQLGNALYPLVGDAKPLEAGLDAYANRFQSGHRRMMAGKLGICLRNPDQDEPLVAELWPLLAAVETDMTLFFRRLADLRCEAGAPDADSDLLAPVEQAFYQSEKIGAEHRASLADWLRRYQQRVRMEGVPDPVRKQAMNRVNPLYVLRNYLAQLAIDKAEHGNYGMVRDLLEVLRHPYTEQPGKEEYAAKRPEWARSRAGCSMLSCSS